MSAGKDTTQSAMMFSDIYDYDTKTNVVVVGTCSLIVLAVGGGKDGCITCGGPGSGYLEWKQISVEGSLMLEVKVGGPGRETEVEIPYNWGGIGGDGGTKVVVAQGGTYVVVMAFAVEGAKDQGWEAEEPEVLTEVTVSLGHMVLVEREVE